jgi:hypothetical protein
MRRKSRVGRQASSTFELTNFLKKRSAYDIDLTHSLGCNGRRASQRVWWRWRTVDRSDKHPHEQSLVDVGPRELGYQHMELRPRNMSTLKRFVMATALLTATTVALGQVTVPNTFTSGTPAKAADVNGNFNAVVTGINSNATAISALQTQVKSIPAGQPGPQGQPGQPGPQGSQGPQGIQGPMGGLAVYEVSGMMMGTYEYPDVVIAASPTGTLYSLHVSQNHLTGVATFYYSDSNCSSQPYIDGSSYTDLPVIALGAVTPGFTMGTTTPNSIYISALSYGALSYNSFWVIGQPGCAVAATGSLTYAFTTTSFKNTFAAPYSVR